MITPSPFLCLSRASCPFLGMASASHHWYLPQRQVAALLHSSIVEWSHLSLSSSFTTRFSYKSPFHSSHGKTITISIAPPHPPTPTSKYTVIRLLWLQNDICQGHNTSIQPNPQLSSQWLEVSVCCECVAWDILHHWTQGFQRSQLETLPTGPSSWYRVYKLRPAGGSTVSPESHSLFFLLFFFLITVY